MRGDSARPNPNGNDEETLPLTENVKWGLEKGKRSTEYQDYLTGKKP